MEYTENLNLLKPELTDIFSKDHISINSDILEETISKLSKKIETIEDNEQGNAENLENVLNTLKYLQESTSNFFLFLTKEETNNLNFKSGDKIFIITDASSKKGGWAFYIFINNKLVLVSEEFSSEINAFFTEEKFEILNLLKKEDFETIEYLKSLNLSIKEEKLCFKENELVTKLGLNEIFDNNLFWKNTNVSSKLEKNGYMILPNGLVMQWGREAIHDEEQDLEFSLKFKKIYTAQVTALGGNDIKLAIRYLENKYITVYFGYIVPEEVLWFAMGEI